MLVLMNLFQVILCAALSYALLHNKRSEIFNAGELTPSLHRGINVYGYVFAGVLAATLTVTPALRYDFVGLVITVLLVYIAIADILYMTVPRQLIFMLFLIAATVSLSEVKNDFYNSLATAGVFYGVTRAVHALNNRAMGLADVRLFTVAGLLLGAKLSVAFFVITYSVAFIIILPFVLMKKVNKKVPIYFTPYMCVGVFVSWVFPDDANSVVDFLLGGWQWFS